MSVTRVKQIFIQLLSKKNTRTVNHPKQTDLTNWNNSKLLKFQKQKSKVSKFEFFKRFSLKNVIFDDFSKMTVSEQNHFENSNFEHFDVYFWAFIS